MGDRRSTPFRGWVLRAAPLLCIALAACGGSSSEPAPDGGRISASAPKRSAAAGLGEKIFNDTALSASGRQSCATCHVARFAFASDPTADGPDQGSPVPLGGPAMNLPGFRNTPSLMYLSFAPPFYFDSDGSPTGGFFRDGRSATLAAQATEPLLTSFEMANADPAEVLTRLMSRPYFSEFESLYGSAVLEDPALTLERMGEAIAAFESEDARFRPFTSKYDYWLRGQARLTAQEQRGLGLFNDPSKGNCAACHPSSSPDGTTPPLFTDFSYDNLGVPRNATIPANRRTTAPSYTPENSDDGVQTYYDLGVCGPLRDPGGMHLSALCGQFKVPTLRNVALTAPYFHNGRFATLQEAIGFYVRRDTDPEQWYPSTADGTVLKFDDLPAAYGGQFAVIPEVPGTDSAYLGNVNTGEIPYDRHIGDTPALSPAEIDDVIAFLCTLTDGYDPDDPAALRLPAQCQTAVAAPTSN